jgi:hypothetical protein
VVNGDLPGRLGSVEMEGELPSRGALGPIFDELDFQMATQAYLWALPLVSYAQWHRVHRDIFGATNFDLVRYVSYKDRLGLITANATTPYILNFIELNETGHWSSSYRQVLPPAGYQISGSVRSESWARWVPTGDNAKSISSYRLVKTHPTPTASTFSGRQA